MLFDSPIYFVFLLLVVPAYWLLKREGQNRLLLVASYIFYGWWDWRFLGLILLSTIVDYWCARAVEIRESKVERKVLLWISLGLNLAFLGFFKYFNFFADSLHPLLEALGVEVQLSTLEILLPPGISFYTFQAVAYIVDVYYRRLPAARSLTDYALFISLFPHLIAGPIQRPDHLLPQVQNPRRFVPAHVFDGLMLIVSGLLRKSVIADNCALIANAAFDGRLGEPSLSTLLVGVYAFAWQIYGDFSGYSDIARGSAQLMGFHFMVNFKQPYLATSLQDFWRRWHISLSTWLRDYLYIPLGGNRLGERKTYRNLITTMLLGGLWHGANWTFVVWGAIHGFGLAIGRLLGSEASEAPRRMGVVETTVRRLFIFHVVCAAWVFFRASSFQAAMGMFAGAGTWTWSPELGAGLLFVGLFAVPMFVIDILNERRSDEYLLASASYSTRVSVALIVLVVIALFSASVPSDFIYFQF